MEKRDFLQILSYLVFEIFYRETMLAYEGIRQTFAQLKLKNYQPRELLSKQPMIAMLNKPNPT